MSLYAVIAQSPSVDVAQGVGPFRSYGKAMTAATDLDSKGYNTEIVPLVALSDVDDSPAWDGS